MNVCVQTEPPTEEQATLYRLSVEQYHRIAEANILTPEDRVELLDGYLVEKMTINPKHGNAVQWLNLWLAKYVPNGWIPRCQSPITLSESEPEPDLVVARGTRSSYRTQHPTPQDIALVIEVADSSLSVDRGLKAHLYAAAGIPEYWIINLVDNCVHIFKQPYENSYKNEQMLQPSDELVLSIQGQTVVREVLVDLLSAQA